MLRFRRNRYSKNAFIAISLVLYLVAILLFPNLYAWLTTYSGPVDDIEVNKILYANLKPKSPVIQLSPKPRKLKYLLLTTRTTPLNRLKEGQATFVQNKCNFQNCFLTSNISYLKNVKNFDAVLFGSPDSELNIPIGRHKSQKYIFASTESAAYCRAMNTANDNFYSWTWTYRLDSDILWRHFRVYDMKGHIIGPAVKVRWLSRKTMKPTPAHYIEKFKKKSKAAVWFASTCKTFSGREEFVSNLIPELQHHGLSVDIYGACGNNSCRNPSSCPEMLQSDYYFYLAFESSIEEDFVSEKVLDALSNFIVPVVYGGADYSRFLPPGSYLDAKKLGPKKLAQKMDMIIKTPSKYFNFFKWKSYYRFESSLQTETCNLCAAMNNKKLLTNDILHDKFRKWWNGASRQFVFDFLSQIIPVDNVLSNLTKNYNYSQQYSDYWFRIFKRRIDVPSYVHFLNQNVEEQIKERDALDETLQNIQNLVKGTTEPPTTETDFTTEEETTTQVLIEDD